MPWFKSETNECQSNDPAEGSFGELFNERRKGWEWKDDGFIPPILPPTQKQQVEDLEEEYSTKRASVLNQITLATALNKTAMIPTLQTKYANLVAEQKARKEVVMNG